MEHNWIKLSASCIELVDELLEDTEVSPRQIEAVGISNRGATTVVWERYSGRSVTSALHIPVVVCELVEELDELLAIHRG